MAATTPQQERRAALAGDLVREATALHGAFAHARIALQNLDTIIREDEAISAALSDQAVTLVTMIDVLDQVAGEPLDLTNIVRHPIVAALTQSNQPVEIDDNKDAA
jgi:hypothetical protein